jgi:hypothetical protein
MHSQHLICRIPHGEFRSHSRRRARANAASIPTLRAKCRGLGIFSCVKIQTGGGACTSLAGRDSWRCFHEDRSVLADRSLPSITPAQIELGLDEVSIRSGTPDPPVPICDAVFGAFSTLSMPPPHVCAYEIMHEEAGWYASQLAAGRSPTPRNGRTDLQRSLGERPPLSQAATTRVPHKGVVSALVSQ